MQIKGAIYKFGNDVDTDQIIPARYLNTTDPAELAAHCMEDADPEFARVVQPGSVMVAGKILAVAHLGNMRQLPLRQQGCPVLSLQPLHESFTVMPSISGCLSWSARRLPQHYRRETLWK